MLSAATVALPDQSPNLLPPISRCDQTERQTAAPPAHPSPCFLGPNRTPSHLQALRAEESPLSSRFLQCSARSAQTADAETVRNREREPAVLPFLPQLHPLDENPKPPAHLVAARRWPPR